MPENPFNNLMFDHIDGFEFSSTFSVQCLSHLPLLQEGTTAKFLALCSCPLILELPLIVRIGPDVNMPY